MPGSSNASFIPKRTTGQRDRQTARKQVYVGTFVVRILFFAALIAVASVYAYESKLKSDLNKEIAALGSAINSFNEAEMQRVTSADLRLSQIRYRLDHTVSVLAVLEAIEGSIVSSAQVSSLEIKRTDDKTLELESAISTPSFDTALFQKGILESSETLNVTAIEDLALEQPQDSEGDPLPPEISLKAILSIDAESVPHRAPTTTDMFVPEVVEEIINQGTTFSDEASATDTQTGDLVEGNQ
jgi:hypothetical protein